VERPEKWFSVLSDEFIASIFYEKIGFKNATDVFVCLILPAYTGGAYNTDSIGIPEKSHKNVAWKFWTRG